MKKCLCFIVLKAQRGAGESSNTQLVCLLQQPSSSAEASLLNQLSKLCGLVRWAAKLVQVNPPPSQVLPESTTCLICLGALTIQEEISQIKRKLQAGKKTQDRQKKRHRDRMVER